LIRDSRGRTIAKTVVYRLVAIALLAGTTYYYTGSAGEATTITILFNVVGTVAYYGLERLWEYVLWGRGTIKPVASQGDGKPATPFRVRTQTAPAPGPSRTESEVNSAQ
jgi:uncharacterized membrane protein